MEYTEFEVRTDDWLFNGKTKRRQTGKKQQQMSKTNKLKSAIFALWILKIKAYNALN